MTNISGNRVHCDQRSATQQCLTLPPRRVVSLGKAEIQDSDRLNQSFEVAWKGLVAGEEIVCQKMNTRYAAAPKPRAIIIDVCDVLSIAHALALI